MVKKRAPRLRKGKKYRYVKVGKKKIKVSAPENVSNKQIILYLLKHLFTKRKRRKPKAKGEAKDDRGKEIKERNHVYRKPPGEDRGEDESEDEDELVDGKIRISKEDRAYLLEQAREGKRIAEATLAAKEAKEKEKTEEQKIEEGKLRRAIEEGKKEEAKLRGDNLLRMAENARIRKINEKIRADRRKLKEGLSKVEKKKREIDTFIDKKLTDEFYERFGRSFNSKVPKKDILELAKKRGIPADEKDSVVNLSKALAYDIFTDPDIQSGKKKLFGVEQRLVNSWDSAKSYDPRPAEALNDLIDNLNPKKIEAEKKARKDRIVAQREKHKAEEKVRKESRRKEETDDELEESEEEPPTPPKKGEKKGPSAKEVKVKPEVKKAPAKADESDSDSDSVPLATRVPGKKPLTKKEVAELFGESEDESEGAGIKERIRIINKAEKQGLSNFDLDEMMRKFPSYGGTTMIDTISQKILPLIKKDKPQKIGWITNLDKSNGPGYHWVAMFLDTRPNGSMSVEYYDPFARRYNEIPKVVMTQVKAIVDKNDPDFYLKFKENLIPRQRANSKNCGYFAANFLADRFRGYSFPVSSGFNSILKNEKLIGKVKERFKRFGYI